MKKKKRGIPIPHTYVLLFSITILMAILTWIVPAGQFERIEQGGRTIAVPNSWQQVEQNPQGFMEVFMSIPKGLAESADIAFFIFIVGGSFAILTETGMVTAFIHWVARKLKGRESLVIPAFLLIFGLAGATLGFAEETIIFIAMGVTLARALGYDALVGVSIVALGAQIGFSAGFMNPFSVGVAQGIAELPTFSGMELRLALFATLWVVTSLYVMRYAHKVKKDPTASLMYNPYQEGHAEVVEEAVIEEMTPRRAVVGLILAVGMGIIAFGVIEFGWFMTEISAVFLAIGVIAGLVYGFGPSKIADTFVNGAKDMVFAAIIVGVARSIVVVMEDGLIIDTIVNSLANVVQILPGAVASVAMYLIQIVINFLIPSGSGQAAATMPIMVPLADAVGVTRQTAVLAYQLGSGFMDSIMITSGVLMGQLSVAKIPYAKWFRYLMPLMGLWLLIGGIFLIFAYYTGYGPF